MNRASVRHVLASVAVAGLCGAYLGPLLLQGWVPFDEGTLGQSAHRVLLGELPHRDFDDVYTGGLALLHAAAFRAFGETMVTLRLVWFVAVVLSVPAFYYVASRFVRPLPAGALTVAAFMVGFPTYPAAMPSWYNLIFATLGCAALLRYLETRRRLWLFAAGLCAGLSVLVKIVGVYFACAGALFLLLHSIGRAPSQTGNGRRRNFGAFALASGITVVPAALAILILLERPRAAELLELGAPIATLCFVIVLEAHRTLRSISLGEFVRNLFDVEWAFVVGTLAPIVSLIVVYAAFGALGPLYRGLLVLPRLRVDWTAVDGPPAVALLVGMAPIGLLTLRRFSVRTLSRFETVVLIVAEVAVVALSAASLRVTAGLWMMVRMACPWIAVAVAAIVWKSKGEMRSVQCEQLFLVASTAAWCALIQFPTDSYQYFLYVLPLFVLAAGAVTAVRATLSRTVALYTLGSFIALAALLRPVFMAGGGSNVVLRSQARARLDLPRGGLIVRQTERDEYVGLVTTIQRHSTGRFIYASPDAPEVYFLAEKENPTRTLFDFFDDSTSRTSRVLAAIKQHDVDVIVINNRPRFSGPMASDLRDSLARSYSDSTEVGNFLVRWRHEPQPGGPSTVSRANGEFP